jgi:hypothetical protein
MTPKGGFPKYDFVASAALTGRTGAAGLACSLSGGQKQNCFAAPQRRRAGQQFAHDRERRPHSSSRVQVADFACPNGRRAC